MKGILLIISLFIGGMLSSQNLVKNGSFEDKSYCPANFNQQKLNTVRDWTQASRSTPDYFHSCSDKAGVPGNIFGEQPAKDGEAYGGIVTYTPSKRNYREYLQSQLTRPLAAGEQVCIEYWLSCSDYALYVTDGFGVHLSKNKVQAGGQEQINAEPQIDNPRLHMLDEKDSWVLVSNVYTAEGGERYITLGNFKKDRELKVLLRTFADGAKTTSDWAYVYVDDIVVKPVKSKQDCSCTVDMILEEIHDPPLELGEVTEVELANVLFAFDDSTLNSEAKSTLDHVAKTLRRHKYMFVEVIGHTDIIGKDGYNLGLSKNRANAVLKYLENKGIDPLRLDVNYKGEMEPVADNESSEGRAQNRRVEFLILERKFILIQ